jgi:peptidoglycan biosynthesis protein MviN/MurJ (putative lipid II flippase)
MMTIGIQILQLPHLVEYFAQKNYEKAFVVINKSKIISLGLSILVTISIMLLAPIAINILFVGGKFTKQDAEITISLLPMFLLPAIGWGVSSVFFQPLLALKKQFQLGLLNCFSLLAAWFIGLQIKRYFGPLPAISSGLIILLFTGIIGSELLWQHYKKNLINTPK